MSGNTHNQELFCPECGNKVSGLHCPNCGLQQGDGHPDDPLNYYPRAFKSPMSDSFNSNLATILCLVGGPLGCIYIIFALNKTKNVIRAQKWPFFYDGLSDFYNKESFIEWTRKVFLTDGNFVVPTFKDSDRNNLLKKFNAYYERVEIASNGVHNHFWFLFKYIESKSDPDVYRSEQLEIDENFKDFYGQEITKRGGVDTFDHDIFLTYIYYTDNLEGELQLSDLERIAGEKYDEIRHDKNIHKAFSVIKTEDKSLFLPEAQRMHPRDKMMLRNLKILFEIE